MSKDPKFVGVPAGSDSVVGAYQQGIRERAAKARAERPKVGDLAEADALVRPNKDTPMTIKQATEAAASLKRDEERESTPGLSAQTVAGLHALHAASQEAHAKAKPPAEEPALEEETPQTLKRAVAADALSHLDDLEFERLMNGIQSDVINNKEQREAIEKLVPAFDLGKCLATGDWTQVVPVVPDQLVVTFRLVSPHENQSIRLLLLRLISEDPRRESIHGDMYSLMMIVASIVQVGGNKMPSHLKGQAYQEEFDEAAFLLKYNIISRYPMPFVHVLGVHSGWFDMRAREAMRVTGLKAG